MLNELMRILFEVDYPFLDLRNKGLAPELRESIAAFWNEAEFSAIAADLRLIPDDFDGLNATIFELAGGERGTTEYRPRMWLDVARRSEDLARSVPVAASLVAVEALAAWIGAAGTNLFNASFAGYNPGWNYFPLSVARNLAAADAIWGARHIVEVASGFIESTHGAFGNESVQSALREYQAVAEQVEHRYRGYVADLAWDLCAACRPSSGPNFRPEVAAIFWASGDVLHAKLMAADTGNDYAPSLSVIRSLVDHSLRRLPDSPLQQYIWLEMKDRPPFDLRAHRVLFSFINNVFAKNAIHTIEGIGVAPPSRAFARVATGYFRNAIAPDERDELGSAFSTHGALLEGVMPVAYICMASLVNLLLTDKPEIQSANWRRLSSMAANVLQYGRQFGYVELLDQSLNIPFCYLPVDTADDARKTNDTIEHYRCGNLWYWLMVTPPPYPSDDRAQPLLNQEGYLLQELRGARFIRLRSQLPQHYSRYNFDVREALDRPPPEGSATAQLGSLQRFDPFDQEFALNELRRAIGDLRELHGKLQQFTPEYAEARLDPFASLDEFIAALGQQKDERT